MMSVPEQVLMSELNKVRRNRLNREMQEQSDSGLIQVPDAVAPPQAPLETDLTSAENQEREIMRLLMLYASEIIHIEQTDENNDKVKIPVMVADYIVHDIRRDELQFENPVFCFNF